MKLTIDNYEIEIKAKSSYSNRFNKNDTLEILSILANAFTNSQERNENKGYEALANRDNKNFYKIYDFLDSNGFFDDLRN